MTESAPLPFDSSLKSNHKQAEELLVPSRAADVPAIEIVQQRCLCTLGALA